MVQIFQSGHMLISINSITTKLKLLRDIAYT
uniref:Uncharacterized protein n=1 Tax=Anguilla anguilla TaxID=7936 RepID=A0A0E9QP72_ANGAN